MVEIVVVTVAVLVLLVTAVTVATELWLRGRGWRLLHRALADRLGAPVDVELADTLLLPVVVGRRDTAVRLHAYDLPVEEASLRELTVELHGVRGSGGLRPRGLVMDGGRFRAVLDERELATLLPLRGVVTRTEVREDGLRLWTVAAVPVDADVIVAGEELLIHPDPAQLSKLLELPGLRPIHRLVSDSRVRVPLPELPLNASVRELGFTAGQVEIRGVVPPQQLGRDGSRLRARRNI